MQRRFSCPQWVSWLQSVCVWRIWGRPGDGSLVALFCHPYHQTSVHHPELTLFFPYLLTCALSASSSSCGLCLSSSPSPSYHLSWLASLVFSLLVVLHYSIHICLLILLFSSLPFLHLHVSLCFVYSLCLSLLLCALAVSSLGFLHLLSLFLPLFFWLLLCPRHIMHRKSNKTTSASTSVTTQMDLGPRRQERRRSWCLQ